MAAAGAILPAARAGCAARGVLPGSVCVVKKVSALRIFILVKCQFSLFKKGSFIQKMPWPACFRPAGAVGGRVEQLFFENLACF
jgi:hypothetical protein